MVISDLDVKEIRRNLKVSQSKLAEMVGLSLRTIQNYEAGAVIPEATAKLLRSLSNINVLGETEAAYKINKSHDAIWVNYEAFKLVPLVTHRAQAGFLSGWGDSEYIEELPKVPWEVDKEYKGKYMTFEVEGYSMESDENPRESLFEGDLLLCREVPKLHWKNKLHIHKWDFVIAHREEGLLVKRITKHDTNTGKLTLHSLNSMYDDKEVFMDDLIAIFNIVDIKRSRRR